jgi:hypothetical protein
MKNPPHRRENLQTKFDGQMPRPRAGVERVLRRLERRSMYLVGGDRPVKLIRTAFAACPATTTPSSSPI